MVLGALLVVLNVVTFPTPPADAGLFDIGPFVGLWYLFLMIRVLIVSRRNSGAISDRSSA